MCGYSNYRTSSGCESGGNYNAFRILSSCGGGCGGPFTSECGGPTCGGGCFTSGCGGGC